MQQAAAVALESEFGPCLLLLDRALEVHECALADGVEAERSAGHGEVCSVEGQRADYVVAPG